MQFRVRHILLTGALLIAAFTIPIVPCNLPPDVWPQSEAEKVKAKIYSAGTRLNAIYLHQRKEDGKELPAPYNVVAKFEENHMMRPLLGPWRYGTSSKSTHAFGIFGLANMPHVIRDDEQRTCEVTPQTISAFLQWAQKATVNPSTGMYVDSN